MRIAYLHQYFTTPSMSGGTRSYEMGRRLVAMGHEVHIITTMRDAVSQSRGWSTSQEAGMIVHWLPVSYSNHMSYRQRLEAFVRFAIAAGPRAAFSSPDVVFASSTPLTVAVPGIYASKRSRAPMVFEVRDLWPDVPIALGALKNPLAIASARALERVAYRSSRRIVALSPGMRDGIRRAGYSSERVTVIPNACDFDLFAIDSDRGSQFRQRFLWLEDRPLIVYTGALGLVNGIGYMVRLAAAVAELDPRIRFLVVGSGREEASVRQLATSLGVLDRTFFLMSSIPKTDLPEVLSAANLATSFVIDNASLWDNSANKFFDALAAARPIAINYEGWQADLIRETGAGLVLHPHHIESAAHQVVAACRDKAWQSRAGAAAHRLGRDRFDRDQLAKQLEGVLYDALGGRPPDKD